MRIWIAIPTPLTQSRLRCVLLCLKNRNLAFSGMAAMGVVGSIAALIWERKRKK